MCYWRIKIDGGVQNEKENSFFIYNYWNNYDNSKYIC